MLATLLRMALVLVTLAASSAWARPKPVAARVLKARQVVLREGPGELGELWVTFTRGGTVTRAVLMLVPHPSEVDTQVRLTLSEKLVRAVGPAEPNQPPTPMEQSLAGAWVLGRRLEGRVLHASSFPLHNPEGAPPFGGHTAGIGRGLLEPVALKLAVGRTPDEDPQARRRLLREAEILGRVVHPNACRRQSAVSETVTRLEGFSGYLSWGTLLYGHLWTRGERIVAHDDQAKLPTPVRLGRRTFPGSLSSSRSTTSSSRPRRGLQGRSTWTLTPPGPAKRAAVPGEDEDCRSLSQR